MIKFHDLVDRAGLKKAVKIVNKIRFRLFGVIFEKMEVPEFLVAADAGDIKTNGKLNMAKTKEVIAHRGGASLSFRNLLRPRLVG